ncbi:hypothetical protein Cgig2_005920 [Carnegiea gigantea]|uniref:Ubiquitin-like protease family profile domain-containing protein n=1 Tax=Carnegiea gigantea TaxID=171969 RepID=A0A9Q1JW41_9CARY|nr:hypothetical protein Cgig2_005920 [Carnegiea gigantea]
MGNVLTLNVCRNFDLIHAREKHVNAKYLKGLINVVPARGVWDRPGKFCIDVLQLIRGATVIAPSNVFAIHIPTAGSSEEVAADLGESFKKGLTSDVCNVFMPLFECVDEHWMLLVPNLRRQQFLVYDSLLTKRALARTDLLNSGKEAVAAALSVATDYADARTWQTDHPLCPQQGNGHDCGVFVMVFMGLISMSSKPLLFNQRYVHHIWDKLLVSLLQGKIAHFPNALQR